MQISKRQLGLCYVVLVVFGIFTVAHGVSTNGTANATGRGTGNGTGNETGFTFLITGGKRIPEGMSLAKYIVSIRSRSPRRYFGDNHFCAGSIIGPRIVLTAAHCVMDKRKVLTRPRRLLIAAGTPNRLRFDPNSTVVFGVQSVFPHPKFITSNSHDIAIIVLKDEIPSNNPHIAIIKLPTAPPPFGTVCNVIGWGRLYYQGPLAAQALHVDIILLTMDDCRKKIKHIQKKEGMICAGDNIKYNGDPCRGDSGGPLVCNDELTAIISWTIGCGSKTMPSLYTDVYYHMDWLKKAEKEALVGSRLQFCVYLFVLVGFVMLAC